MIRGIIKQESQIINIYQNKHSITNKCSNAMQCMYARHGEEMTINVLLPSHICY